MSETQNEDEVSMQENGSKEQRSPLRQMIKLCDCGLFSKYPLMAVVAFSMFFGLGIGFMGAPAYMVARAKSINLGSEGNIALVMSIFGVAGIVGRLSPPAILHFTPTTMTSTRLFGLAQILGGITNILSSFADSYPTYCVYAAILGLITGVFNTMISQTMKDVIGPSNLTAGLSVTSPWISLAGLIGPPLAGWIYDQTQDYNNSFYFYGSSMLFSGFAFLLFDRIYYLYQEKVVRVSDVKYKVGGET
ncbi:monocarboxylate transporter 9-like [Glandiceps talaboti]